MARGTSRPVDLHKTARRFLLVLSVLAAFAVALGFLGAMHPAIDLVSHFQIPLLLGGAVLFGLAALFRARASVVIMLAVLVVTGARIAPYWPGLGSGPVVEGAPIRVMVSNVFSPNKQHQLILDEVRHVDPDVLVIIECSGSWERALGPLGERYSHTLLSRLPGDQRYGVAIFSKYELHRRKLPVGAGEVNLRALVADVATPAGPVRLIAAHPYPPISIRASRYRDRQLETINQMVRDCDGAGPVMVIGDLNTTPWSHGHRALTSGTTLRNARLGYGIRGTWNTKIPGLFQIPIDHVIVNDRIGVRGIETGAHIGSDHLPIIAELTIEMAPD